ncbi:HIT domain-containing protein [Candidatus Collierbacteria bacterium]|nr:HIT domain-containing protein [Candidatus Collierbacteria bacterium]
MQQCIFCLIAAAKIPSYKVFEDDNFLAFLDIRPVVKGHSLVIPKKHSEFFYDVPKVGKLFEVVKKVSLASKKALNSAYVQIRTLGLAVPHAHVHVLPMESRNKEHPDWSKPLSFTSQQLSEISSLIRSNL